MQYGRTRAGQQGHGAGRRHSRALLQLFAVALASVTLASCAHAVASTTVELPPLEMPEPPPRVVEVIEPEPSLPVVALPEEPRTNVRSRPLPPRTDLPRQEPPRTDPVIAETPRPTEDAPKAAPPPTTLQTTPTQREGEVERRIRILVAQARNDLNRVNYQALNTDARNQYEMAKRFATQAEDAVRTRNLMFATNLADKAAGLAAQLLGR